MCFAVALCSAACAGCAKMYWQGVHCANAVICSCKVSCKTHAQFLWGLFCQAGKLLFCKDHAFHILRDSMHFVARQIARVSLLCSICRHVSMHSPCCRLDASSPRPLSLLDCLFPSPGEWYCSLPENFSIAALMLSRTEQRNCILFNVSLMVS